MRELLARVGLSPEHINRFPHEFSGGQRQRIGIARALALEPRLIVLDEPVSALDVSIQAQIVNLLDDLQDDLGLTYLFVAHDLSVVRHISDSIAVMYLGKIMEVAPAEELYSKPIHPYTQALLGAIPIPDPELNRRRTRAALEGEPPSAIAAARGLPFPPAVPARHRYLPHGRAAARRIRRWPSRGLPPSGQRQRVGDRRRDAVGHESAECRARSAGFQRRPSGRGRGRLRGGRRIWRRRSGSGGPGRRRAGCAGSGTSRVAQP